MTGCSHVSPGCDRCYAETMSKRFAGKKGWGPKDDPFRVTMHPERVEKPGFPRKPSRIFVCSMGDLFHQRVSDIFRRMVFEVMRQHPEHTFQILTKRPSVMRSMLTDYKGIKCPNAWLGVTAENQEQADKRIPILLDTPAALRFVSCEPLLGPINLRPYLSQLDWVIVGGETGPGARFMNGHWVDSLGKQCGYGANVPMFLKQWGTGGKTNRPTITEGMQQFPWVRAANETKEEDSER